MRLRDLTNDDRERLQPDDSPSGGDNLARLRSSGQEMLAAGAQAINRALSGDSEKFLKENRQHGGE